MLHNATEACYQSHCPQPDPEDCWMCWHDEISRDLEGCTVYLLYREEWE